MQNYVEAVQGEQLTASGPSFSADLHMLPHNSQETFIAACAELGIEGVDIPAELKALGSRLPEVASNHPKAWACSVFTRRGRFSVKRRNS